LRITYFIEFNLVSKNYFSPLFYRKNAFFDLFSLFFKKNHLFFKKKNLLKNAFLSQLSKTKKTQATKNQILTPKIKQKIHNKILTITRFCLCNKPNAAVSLYCD